MKNLLIIAFLLMPFPGISQTTTKPIDSFLSLNFGSPKVTILNYVKENGGTYEAFVSKANLTICYNVMYGTHMSKLFGVKYFNNKAYLATFVFKADEDNSVLNYYSELIKEISAQYDNGVSVKKFKSPYKEGDGLEISAIQKGYADYQTVWTDQNKNSITLTINSDDLSISLQFLDNKISRLAGKKR